MADTLTEVVRYGPDLPTEADLRLCGDARDKRVLDLGCGRGQNAVTFARQGAHVIAIDRSEQRDRIRSRAGRTARGARRMAPRRRRRPRVPAGRLDRPRALRRGALRDRRRRPALPPGAPRAAGRRPVRLLLRAPDGARRRPRRRRPRRPPARPPRGPPLVLRARPRVGDERRRRDHALPAHCGRHLRGAAPGGIPRRRAARTGASAYRRSRPVGADHDHLASAARKASRTRRLDWLDWLGGSGAPVA